ncbi:MAG: hypothetical protein RSF67_09255 [Clostridia bacterium]
MKNELSTKDLSYICDMFNWNLNIYNVCNEYLECISDEELIRTVNNIKTMHLNSCNDFLKVIK